MARTFPDTLLGFQRMFPDEVACVAYLEDLRWPAGFVCPACGVGGAPQRIRTRPRVLRCRGCLDETSVTAGTILHATRTPLQAWFWAAYLITSQTPGMSALQFQRQLGIRRYETAFQMLHKLRASMVRPHRDKIGREYLVELDEAEVGGQTRGEGRGVHHMATVVGAVEVRQSRNINSQRDWHRQGIPTKRKLYAGRLRLRHVPRQAAITINSFALDNVAEGTTLVTDGWNGYDDLKHLGYKHEPVILGGDPKRAEAALPMIHLVFSNLKAWLLGTHHGVSKRHLQAYLNEYVFRFNRRFYPMGMFNSVLGIAATVRGPTYEQLYDRHWVHPNP